jgi:beta-lactamase class D
MKTYEEVDLHEKTAFKICVKLISHRDSDFMIAPMSQKRFIVNEKLNVFIIIDYGRVEITNHIFHYDVKLSLRDYERITYLYDTETEKRRVNTETEVKSNIKNSLQNILNKLTEKIEKEEK